MYHDKGFPYNMLKITQELYPLAFDWLEVNLCPLVGKHPLFTGWKTTSAHWLEDDRFPLTIERALARSNLPTDANHLVVVCTGQGQGVYTSSSLVANRPKPTSMCLIYSMGPTGRQRK
jgi:hypothetical protein